MENQDDENPFQKSMIPMQAPENSGESVSARGFTMKLDKNRCVTVPQDVAAELRNHGFVEFKAVEKPVEKPVEKAK